MLTDEEDEGLRCAAARWRSEKRFRTYLIDCNCVHIASLPAARARGLLALTAGGLRVVNSASEYKATFNSRECLIRTPVLHTAAFHNTPGTTKVACCSLQDQQQPSLGRVNLELVARPELSRRRRELEWRQQRCPQPRRRHVQAKRGPVVAQLKLNEWFGVVPICDHDHCSDPLLEIDGQLQSLWCTCRDWLPRQCCSLAPPSAHFRSPPTSQSKDNGAFPFSFQFPFRNALRGIVFNWFGKLGKPARYSLVLPWLSSLCRTNPRETRAQSDRNCRRHIGRLSRPASLDKRRRRDLGSAAYRQRDPSRRRQSQSASCPHRGCCNRILRRLRVITTDVG